MSEQQKSWVSRRVADLEARSTTGTTTPKASTSTSPSTSPSTAPSSPPPQSSLKTKPVVFQREHRHPPPPNPSEKRTAAAGGGGGPGRDMTVEHRLADQADIMAKRITELEAALATSGRRIARLSSAATAAAATAPSHTRHADQAIAEVERCCATRVGQLEDALMQAEKRASWLQEELKVVWACGAQRVRELENTARKLEEGEGKRNMPGRSSAEESGEAMDKMEGTREALSGLRTRFYRVLRERNKLKSRCDRLSENLGELNNAAPPPQNRETDIVSKDNKSKSNQNGGCATRGDKSRCGAPGAPAKSKRAPASGVDDMCSWRWSPPDRAGTGTTTRIVPGGE